MIKVILILAGLFCLIACSDSEKISVEHEEKSMSEVRYSVSSDFANRLAESLNENSANHKGVKSLLEMAGIGFDGETVVMLDGGNRVLIYYGKEDQHRKLRKLVEEINKRGG